jgi:YWFCY protein/Type IV secretory system Conjugative DNA transfer
MGEHDQGINQILEFTRFASYIILFLHYYYYCYPAFLEWNLTSAITDQFLIHIARTGLFDSVYYSKIIALGLLILSHLGAAGKKAADIRKFSILTYSLLGILLFLFSHPVLELRDAVTILATIYMTASSIGFILLLTAMGMLHKLIRLELHHDIFNELNESFPQEENLLENEYSINLPARYKLRGRSRKSWINIINPFRGLLVMGSPGSGKSWFVIQHVIKQHLEKGFSMLVYDFKYDDLTKIAYHSLQKHAGAFKVRPGFYLVNFDDLSRSRRCNPLDPATMFDITDASESSRSILMGLNREWITRQGDFFVESPINFLTAIIWFLKKYKNGRFCTLPHSIELMQVEYEKLFPVLRMEKEIEVLINPFISAYKNNAMEQLEGQVASAKIGMARLSSPQLYWVLNGNDFSLDINNPKEPKILCLANNPQKQQVFGAVLSLYVNRLIKLVNQKNRQKCSLIFDEFPTIFINGIDSLIATARSNRVATCLGLQDFSQLRKDYGLEQASVIFNIAGNIISGQVSGDTAKSLSERFGRIVQLKESISVNRQDTSVSRSSQLDYAIPTSKIAGLSSGEFVGMVADDPDRKIKLKAFHCEILNDYPSLKNEQDHYKQPPILSDITQQMLIDNYFQVKKDVTELINAEIDILMNTPGEWA